jgi:hypothetical protein
MRAKPLNAVLFVYSTCYPQDGASGKYLLFMLNKRRSFASKQDTKMDVSPSAARCNFECDSRPFNWVPEGEAKVRIIGD